MLFFHNNSSSTSRQKNMFLSVGRTRETFAIGVAIAQSQT